MREIKNIHGSFGELLMDWENCVIYGGGGDLKCPAVSYLKNGLEVYGNFVHCVNEFEEVKSLPVPVDFKGEDSAETFMDNKAKWHKSCHLKFAPSKFAHVKQQLVRTSSLEDSGHETQRKSQRISVGTPSLCSKVDGKLHNCTTMTIDHDLRQITDLRDTKQLARILGFDLVAIEAKYHFNCLSTYKSISIGVLSEPKLIILTVVMK